jgi:integrase
MDHTAPGSLLRSFERHLRAQNRSERTVGNYLENARRVEVFLEGRGKRLEEATQADLEDFLGDILRRRSANTAATRYKVMRVLYRWLEEEEELPNPMARMKPPIIPERPIPIVPDDGLRRLLAACAGKDFEARRDTAIIMLTPAPAAPSWPICSSPMSISTWTYCWCSARVVASGRCRSGTRPGRPWSATFASAPVTSMPSFPGSGLA